MKRLRAEYPREGAGALAHGNRGKRPANALDPQQLSRLSHRHRPLLQMVQYQHPPLLSCAQGHPLFFHGVTESLSY